MIRRSTKIAVEILAGLTALGAVVAGVLLWRLSQGPVSLDFLTPRLEAALSEAREGVDVKVGGTVLTWEGWPETIALRITDVSISSDGETLARLPASDLKLSFPALVSGTLAPTEIAARGARVTVVRGADGLRFGAGESPEAQAEDAESDVSSMLPAVLGELMAPSRPDRRLSYLETVRIVDARVRVEDDVLGIVWRAPQANIALRRQGYGIAGTADLRVRLGGDTVSTSASLRYRQAEGRIGVLASVRGLSPRALAADIPRLAMAANIGVPLSGTIATSFDLAGRFGDVTLELRGGQGDVSWPGQLPEPLPVRAFEANARLDPGDDELAVEHLRLDFGTPAEPGPRIESGMTVSDLRGDVRVQGRASVAAVPLDDLGRYWPQRVGDDARRWVTENIRAGVAENARMTFEAALPGGDPAAAVLHGLDGTIAYRGVDVHYLRPMPPVTEVSGSAAFDAGSLRLDVRDGRLHDLHVPRATIDITGLDTPEQWIAIDIDVDGPLQTALATLDHPRLELMQPLGIEPGNTTGRADTNAVFRFPLIDDLTMEQIDVEARARLRRVEAQNFLLGQDASGGDFDLRVDDAGMTLDGPVALAGVPLRLQWRETFAASAEHRSEIDARIPRLTTADLGRLGVDTRGYLEGPISANLRARTDGAGSGFVKAAVNLQDAALALPAFDWKKPPGDPGKAELDLRLRDGRPRTLQRIALDAGGDLAPALSTHGSATFGADGASLQRLMLDRFTLRHTRLDRLSVERAEAGWAVAFAGGTFDAAPFLARERGAAGTDSPGGEGDSAATPTIELRQSKLSRLRFADGRFLSDVILAGRRDGEGWWRRLHLEAAVPARFAPADPGGDEPAGDAGAGGPSRLYLDYAPRPDGRRSLRITAANAGATLRAVNMIDTVTGGKLDVQGLSRGPAPSSPVDAAIDLRDFKVVRAPVLAKVLTIASLTGIGDLLRGDGIGFQRLTGDVVLDGSVLSSDFVHAYGPALGITAKGRIDVEADTSDLQGTIVPAAAINRVLGHIPVLGRLLTGGKGEGIIAVTYRVSGRLSEPEVDVNPLSALAPGFLRGLFGLSAGTDGGEDPPRALPQDSGR